MDQLTFHRTFDAPRDVVWRAFTEPALAREWYAPEDLDCPIFETDLRTGGAIRIHMRTPDGTIYPSSGKVEEVRAPERFVTWTRVELGEVVALEARTTATFAERDGGTDLTVRQEYLRVAPQFSGARAGAEAGWTSSLEKLRGVVAREAGGR